MFDKILRKTLKWEGGFSSDPDDPGGVTHYGITIGTLKSLGIDLNGDQQINIDDIKALTPEKASEIYLKHYFEAPGFDNLPSGIQPIMFDMGVNHGPVRATRLLQHTINLTGFAQIAEDGICGKITTRSADRAYQAMGHFFINALCDERQAFYERLVIDKPALKKFIRGWTNRTNDFRIYH